MNIFKTPSDELNDCFIDLFNFAAIGPNSWITLCNKTNHFIQTGGVWGSIPGMQTLARTYEIDPDFKMLEDFGQFTYKITRAVSYIFQLGRTNKDTKIKRSCFLRIVMVYQFFNYAYKGWPDNSEGGLRGILKTYAAKNEIYEPLRNHIGRIQEVITTNFKKARDWYKIDGKVCLDWSKESNVKNQEEASKAPSYWKYYTNYTIPLACNQACYYLPGSNWRPWDVIYSDHNGCKLVLGDLPSTIQFQGAIVRDDLKDFKEAGIGSILSVVEHFEITSPGWVIDPISPEIWQANGINQLELPVPDFNTTDLATIEKGVDYIHSEMSQGRSVYVHCKVGRGRSYMLTVCYLMKHVNLSLQEAMKLIKEKRPQVNLDSSDDKMLSIHLFACIYDPAFVYDSKMNLETADPKVDAPKEFELLEVTVETAEEEAFESQDPPQKNCIVS